MATTTDFREECREAFLGHCQTLAGIDPNEPTKRNQNRRRRADLLRYIDDILDTANDWREVEPFERELAS